MSRRTIAIVVLAAAGVAALFLVLLVTWIHGTSCTGFDGGVPYVATDSPRKSFCDATGNGAIVFLGSLVAVAGLGALAIRRSRAWIAGVATISGFLALALATALAPIGILALSGIPSSDCTGEQVAENEAWREAGGNGSAPHSCERY